MPQARQGGPIADRYPTPTRGEKRTSTYPAAPTLLAAVSRVVSQTRRNRQSFGRNFADHKLGCYHNSTYKPPSNQPCQSTKGRVGCPELHHNRVPTSSEAYQEPPAKSSKGYSACKRRTPEQVSRQETSSANSRRSTVQTATANNNRPTDPRRGSKAATVLVPRCVPLNFVLNRVVI